MIRSIWLALPKAGSALALFMSAVSLPAHATLVSLDVTLADPSFPLTYSDTVAVADGKEIFPGNPTNIGQAQVFGSSLLLANEYVDAQPSNRIVLGLEAGSGDNTGYGAGASYLFSNLRFGTPSIITDVDVSLDNIDGVTKGTQVVFGPHSVQVFIDTLTIPQFRDACISDAQCGTITLDLIVQQVPEPGACVLLLAGIGIVGIIARRRGRDSS